MGSFDYINQAYGLSVRRGSRVEYTGVCKCQPKIGRITSARGQYIRIRFDGETKSSGPFHPTWEMRYLGDPQP